MLVVARTPLMFSIAERKVWFSFQLLIARSVLPRARLAFSSFCFWINEGKIIPGMILIPIKNNPNNSR